MATRKSAYNTAVAATKRYSDPKTRFHDRSQTIRDEFTESLQHEMMFKLSLVQTAHEARA